MVPVIEKLLIVQEHDRKIRAMQKEILDIPARKQEEQARLEEHRRMLVEAGEALKAKQSELKGFELEADSRAERINKLRQQQLEIKTNKEFRAISAEIEGVEKEIAALEDRELEMMEVLESYRGDAARRAAAVAEEQELIDSDVEALDLRVAGIEAELAELARVRQATAEPVDPEWLAAYEKIFTRKDQALVPVHDSVCGGCHMRLPPSVVNETRKQTSRVMCDFCGRMLYS